MSAAFWWVDGAFVAVAGAAERGAFETMGARAGALPLWARHLARLAQAAARLGVDFAPPADLRAAAGELLARTGQRDGILRLELAVAASARPRWSMTARARAGGTGPVRLALVEMQRPADDPHAGFKSTARAPYDAALARARAAGGEEALLVDARGEVLEGTTSNVFALVDGVLCTPPRDGRIVPGIARALLLEGLAARGTPAAERPLQRDEVGAAAGLWITNAVHGARAAVLAAGPVAPPAGPWSRRLAEIWAEALAQA